ncbi:MAG: cobalt-precorrin 5A hydrolase [Clostridia bacterium]|nr:cobalt-precorrin 5A hydrolase [Clostridia bacterium]
MKIAIFAYSKRGRALAIRLKACIKDCEVCIFVPERLKEAGLITIQSLSADLYKELFSKADALVFIGSCGIAVRNIAPYVHNKQTDPAVIVIDELGRFVIPILSGHIGGANALALKLSEYLEATPVITTATDINHRFSPDAWAKKNGFVIGDISLVKTVSAAILERDVPMICDLPVKGDYPRGIQINARGDTGILISYKTGAAPFEKTLCLIPVILHVGIGCKKGTSAEQIKKAIENVFSREGIDKRAVKLYSTIDLKANEPGLISYCRAEGKPLVVYGAKELRAVEGDFVASDFVKSVTGVDNVCERAAMAGAHELVVKKTAAGGVTVAVAAENTEVCFE